MSITTELIETGEKRDRRGHRISSLERRAEAVRAWRGSGLTMAAFARRESIEYSTFAGWVLKAARKRPTLKRPRFAEVQVGPLLAAATPGLLEVRFRSYPKGSELSEGVMLELSEGVMLYLLP